MSNWPAFLFWLGLTGGIWYLESVDRKLPVSVQLVEWEGRLGIPIYVVPALIALVTLGNVLWRMNRSAGDGGTARDLRQAPTRSLSRAQDPLSAAAAGSWHDEAVRNAKALTLEPQGQIRLGEAMGLPFTLMLRNATVEQARRRIDQYVAFLASIPTPPKGRMYLDSSPDVQVAPQHLLGAAMKKYFQEDQFYLMVQGGSVDIVFSRPDPRWAGR
jgi:hypothetical protein